MYVNPLIDKLERKYPSGNRSNLLRLDMNENPEGLPKEVVEELKGLVTPEFLATYPDKELLLKSLGDFHNLEKENIAITDGSEMALKYIFEVFGKPNSKLVTVFPTFEMYGVYANMYGLIHEKISVSNSFDIDVTQLLNSIDNTTSIVALLNPNNPIGRPYTDKEFRAIADKAQSVEAILIIDEAYHFFYPYSQEKLLDKYDNIIILRTFSKIFSIAACRIGYALSNPYIIEMVNRARPTFDTNSLAIVFANQLINNKELLEKLINTEKKGREYLINQLEKACYQYNYNGGNYITIHVRTSPDNVSQRLLEEYGIAIKTSRYSQLLGCIRVTTASQQLMEEFWHAFIHVDC